MLWGRVGTHSKVRNEAPLLHGLVVGGFSSDQRQGEGQPRVVRTNHHRGLTGAWKNTHTHATIYVKVIFISEHNFLI